MNHHSFLIKHAIDAPSDREESKRMLKSVLLTAGLGMTGGWMGKELGSYAGLGVGSGLNMLHKGYNYKPLSTLLGYGSGLLGGTVGGSYLAHKLMREKKNEPESVS